MVHKHWKGLIQNGFRKMWGICNMILRSYVRCNRVGARVFRPNKTYFEVEFGVNIVLSSEDVPHHDQICFITIDSQPKLFTSCLIDKQQTCRVPNIGEEEFYPGIRQHIRGSHVTRNEVLLRHPSPSTEHAAWKNKQYELP